MEETKISLPAYRFTQFLAQILSLFVFRRKVIRNELKRAKGPYLVIANHECIIDFVNLIGLTRRPMHFVISRSFFNTLPFRETARKIGVMPKQQFQTKLSDLRQIKDYLNADEPVAIYPAGLMSADGLSTPIPRGTYKFIKWLGVDVYAARTTGAYFVMPKWAKGIRPARTLMDVYKLFDKEELKELTEDEVRLRAEPALLYDAYREEEEAGIHSVRNQEISGLQYVLFRCPHCGTEGQMKNPVPNTIRCDACAFEEHSDQYGLLHKVDGPGEELRYVSDWSLLTRETLWQEIASGRLRELSDRVEIKLLDVEKKKYRPAGSGRLTLREGSFLYEGKLNGEDVSLELPTKTVPTLPVIPGKHFEIQQGDTIYRCLPENKACMMKFVYMTELFYERSKAE